MDESKCSSVDEWIDKLWNTYMMEYYSATKRNKELAHATMRMNLKYFMLRKRRQTAKVMYCLIPFIGNSQNRETHTDRKQMGGGQGAGSRK